MTGWGPYFWATFHIASLTAGPFLDETDKAAFSVFVEGFTLVLPCPKCRVHFAEVLVANPIDYENVFEWSVKVHNEVNAKLGKPLMTLEDALAHWSKKTVIRNNPPDHSMITILAIIILIGLVFFLLRK